MDHRAWDERYASTELIWTAEPNRFLVAEAGGLAPGRALDLACGEGRNAVWLATQRWEVTGVDFSRTGLDKARHLARQRHVTAEWILADVTTYRPSLTWSRSSTCSCPPSRSPWRWPPQ
jgi:2-polyprenyl-3-methyl-5-hydroxy-6-metoxy-1,4-benzoquinol methylase